ncbi:rod shape-determining protein MreC [Bengtsoniella intestinalis]|uniref:rod shape-determining protein MreC n=1 Tax=Bengtsoniella intestinalis TaxID=3073143 RepID=UPI00391FC2B9
MSHIKRFFKRNGLWVLFATALLSIALAVGAHLSANATILENIAGVVLSPINNAHASLTAWVADKSQYYADNTALLEENAALKLEIANMEEAIRQAELDSAENARFRKLLSLREQRQDLTIESANITARSTTNWTETFTLNRGTDHGIQEGNMVITEEGYLVGVIDTAGSNWSTVLTLVDTDTSLGAQVFRTSDLGLVQGDFSLMAEQRLRLDYLPQDTSLLAGDLIVTSGLGNYYPSGIVIGTVESVQTDDSGAASYAIIAPEADLNHLVQVFVIKEFDIVD